VSEGQKTEKTGIATVVAEEHDPAAAVPGDQSACDQLELLPLRKVEEGAEARSRGISVRGRGRPPGAKNKNTEAWREFMLSRYPSPLMGLAEVMIRPVQDLATELNCKKLEAFQIQMAAMKELAPYLHSKQPQAVDLGESGLINLVINTGDQSQQNQGVTDIEFIDSNAQQSNGSTEGIENEE
jgi:hypothetical protein